MSGCHYCDDLKLSNVCKKCFSNMISHTHAKKLYGLNEEQLSNIFNISYVHSTYKNVCVVYHTNDLYNLSNKLINDPATSDKIVAKLSNKKFLLDNEKHEKEELEKKCGDIEKLTNEYVKKFDQKYLHFYVDDIQSLIKIHTDINSGNIDIAMIVCNEIEKKIKNNKVVNDIKLEQRERKKYADKLLTKSQYDKHKFYLLGSCDYNMYIGLKIDTETFIKNINKYVRTKQNEQTRQNKLDSLINEKFTKARYSMIKCSDTYINFINDGKLSNICDTMNELDKIIQNKKNKESRMRKLNSVIKKIKSNDDIGNTESQLKLSKIYDQYVNYGTVVIDKVVCYFMELIKKYKITEERKKKIQHFTTNITINNTAEEYIKKYVCEDLSEKELKDKLIKCEFEHFISCNPPGSKKVPQHIKKDVCDKLFEFKYGNVDTLCLHNIYSEHNFFVQEKCNKLKLKTKIKSNTNNKTYEYTIYK